ncbi:hypothetical protein GQ600_1402 [Phytophthora cactorum]|nr:hypothetical protein GQ600_1402 [Phytophthora cactorum]
MYTQSWAGTEPGRRKWTTLCWIRSWSDDQWSEQAFYVQLVIFYLPVVLTFLHNIVTYVMLLYLMVSAVAIMLHPAIMTHRCVKWVDRQLVDKHGDSDPLSTSALQLAFFLPNVWIVFAFAYQAVAPSHILDAPLLYLTSFFTLCRTSRASSGEPTMAVHLYLVAI